MFLFCLILSAFGGDRMSAGEILKEDSYVFTIEEAENLKSQIIELEEKERQLEIYKKMVEEYEKDDLYRLSDKYKETYIDNLKKINSNNQLIIDGYMKKNKFEKYRNASYFAMGATFAYSAIYMGTLLVVE